MSALNDFWNGLSRGARMGFVMGLAAIVTAVALLAWATLRTDYGVLFSDLNDRDLAAMAGELDKMKVAYKVDDAGRTLLVPRDQVHKVRIKLMGTPVALHGAVGFELFNSSDLAMTDFAQKVNYQRALQGELTRTILSLDEIQNARVHLALPEQGLFRKAATKAKASVTVHLKPGRVLAGEQVAGIQRLVAASVNDIAAEDVAILDQHGVVLSRGAIGTEPAVANLDQKQGTEAYLAKKALAVVDKLYGPGESLVTVDAEFRHEQTRVTTEEVLPARPASADSPATGVIVRERVSTHEAAGADKAGSSTQETDYQTGKRTEQVVSPAGQLKRLNVAVVVRRPLDAADMDKVRDLVSAAVGLDRQRGDAIAVQSMSSIASSAEPASAVSTAKDDTAPAAPLRPEQTAVPPRQAAPYIAVLLALAALAALAGLAWVLARRRTMPPGHSAPLNDAQRAELLGQVRHWLEQDATAAGQPTLKGR